MRFRGDPQQELQESQSGMGSFTSEAVLASSLMLAVSPLQRPNLYGNGLFFSCNSLDCLNSLSQYSVWPDEHQCEKGREVGGITIDLFQCAGLFKIAEICQLTPLSGTAVQTFVCLSLLAIAVEAAQELLTLP